MKFVQTSLLQFWWCVGLEDMELGRCYCCGPLITNPPPLYRAYSSGLLVYRAAHERGSIDHRSAFLLSGWKG